MSKFALANLLLLACASHDRGPSCVRDTSSGRRSTVLSRSPCCFLRLASCEVGFSSLLLSCWARSRPPPCAGGTALVALIENALRTNRGLVPGAETHCGTSACSVWRLSLSGPPCLTGCYTLWGRTEGLAAGAGSRNPLRSCSVRFLVSGLQRRFSSWALRGASLCQLLSTSTERPC